MHPHLPARTHREIGGVYYAVDVLVVNTGTNIRYECETHKEAETIKNSWDAVADPHHPVYVENVATITEEDLP